MERLLLRFRGRVQGVGFRETTRRLALRNGVTGWVRNEPDRTVTSEAQGDRADLALFLAELTRDMRTNIQGVEREEIPVVEEESSFEIRS